MHTDRSEILRKGIELRAFEIYTFRCEYCIPGNAESDWVQAEKEMIEMYKPGSMVNLGLG